MSCNSCIASCEASTAWRPALQLLTATETPDAVTVASCLSAVGRGLQALRARELLNRLAKEARSSSFRSFWSLFCTFRDGHRMEMEPNG